MPSYSFPKSSRLLNRRDFLRFRTDSKKFVGEAVVIRYRQGPKPSPRLGITVKKTYGKAHTRNHFKRKTREAFRHISHALVPGIEVSVMPKKSIDEHTLRLIEKDFTRFASYDITQKSP